LTPLASYHISVFIYNYLLTKRAVLYPATRALRGYRLIYNELTKDLPQAPHSSTATCFIQEVEIVLNFPILIVYSHATTIRRHHTKDINAQRIPPQLDRRNQFTTNCLNPAHIYTIESARSSQNANQEHGFKRRFRSACCTNTSASTAMSIQDREDAGRGKLLGR
jgi:hypothetical protein